MDNRGRRAIENCKENFPEISDLEIHFYGMKYWGAWEIEMEKGISRPVFYFLDNERFSLISFMISERDSPYSAESDEILFDGEVLPFRTVKAVRLGYKLPYYYFRGPISPLHPTLDNENILNINFRPNCAGNCDYCFYGYRSKHLKNIDAKEGIRMVMNENNMDDFREIDEIAIVTGRFPNEEQLKDHIKDVIRFAHDNGFNGRIFYIGSQLTNPTAVTEVLDALDNVKKFKYAFTVERFFDRDKIIHGKKGKKTYPEIVKDLKRLKSLGIEYLQYTYLVGIEDLDKFMKGSEGLVPYAKPHISIFRKTGLLPNERSRSDDYVKLGPEYTCIIRKHYEELYREGIVGNNFANLWSFPRERVSPEQYLKKISDPLEVQNV